MTTSGTPLPVTISTCVEARAVLADPDFTVVPAGEVGPGSRRSEVKTRFGTAGAPAPSPAALSKGPGSRRSEVKTRFGTAGAPAPSPAGLSKGPG
ncbi:MAG: hypothetical protein M3508_08350, partial [Actinomycetota bacterium]|nr:hypothetical protein [Actinomycetota bacterium]